MLEAKVLDTGTGRYAVLAARRGPSLAFEPGSSCASPWTSTCERIARRSPSSSAGGPVHEFYGIVVPGGPLSRPLGACSRAIRCNVAPNPAGFLVCPKCRTPRRCGLSPPPGIAPFLSNPAQPRHRGAGSSTSSWSSGA